MPRFPWVSLLLVGAADIAAAQTGAPPSRAPAADRINSSRPAPVPSRQPIGSFPENESTGQPAWRPDGGQQGMAKTVASLQRTLTDLQQLQLQTKQAHWNVSGTLADSLHERLQEHYEGLSKYADNIAERLLSIGVSADGRANTIVRGSTVPEIPGGFLDDAEVIRWFIYAYKAVGEALQTSIKESEDVDPTTANQLQEVKYGIDKYQWQMRWYLQNTKTDPNTGADLNNGRPIGLPPAPKGQGSQ